MVFFCGVITFVTLILSINALGFVKSYTRKSWVKICILGGASVALSMIFVEVSTILLLAAVLLFLISEGNKIINSLIAETLGFFLLFILDLLISPIFLKVIDGSVVWGTSGQFVSAVTRGILSITICKCICGRLKRIMGKFSESGFVSGRVLKRKYTTILGCIIILTICTANIYVMRGFVHKIEFLYFWITISMSYCIICVIIAFILYKNLKSEVIAEVKERQLKDIREYNENLEIFYKDMRKFRHDYINILSSMAGYIEDSDMNGLRNYFERRIVPISTDMKEKNFRIGLLHNIAIKEVKGVVLTKVMRAQQLGISVYIDIAEEINSVNFDVVDLSRCIGILLDNAIESAAMCCGGEIKIGFVKKNDSLMVAIINSVIGDVPPVHKIYEKGFSTKGKNRGIGLSNLREVLSKYSQATLETVIEENEFKQILEIY